ncbi:hypothetical protein [Streptomyces sp. NPDC094031]|uniref:hypothetical protein n=1 Tax=Streptomyces sp. NPDC094031 TaxID=3155307 RepID=UPI00332EA2CC
MPNPTTRIATPGNSGAENRASLDDLAVTAEQMRADLADFLGRRANGASAAVDLLRAMHLSRTGWDFAVDPESVKLHLGRVTDMSRNLDNAQVWVASPALTAAVTDHELVTSSDGYLLESTDEAPAPVGVVLFADPITDASDLPIYGLAWESEGTGENLQLAVTALTRASGLYDTLPPRFLPQRRDRSLHTPNAMVLAVSQVSTSIQSYGHHPHWGAAPASILVGLLLAFWDLRPAFEHDERTVTQKTGKGRKLRVKFRPVRVIRETATRYTGTPVPAEHEHQWAEQTLRWKVQEQWSWRCPNPRNHKAIIEAGGTCPKVRVRVREHVNGPKGRELDPRSAVRINTSSTKTSEPG